jgi:hypothetical protein
MRGLALAEPHLCPVIEHDVGMSDGVQDDDGRNPTASELAGNHGHDLGRAVVARFRIEGAAVERVRPLARCDEHHSANDPEEPAQYSPSITSGHSTAGLDSLSVRNVT